MGNLFRKPQDVDGTKFTEEQNRKFESQWNGVIKWFEAMAVYNIIIIAIAMVFLLLVSAVDSFSAQQDKLGLHLILVLPLFGIFIVWVDFKASHKKWPKGNINGKFPDAYISCKNTYVFMASLIITIVHAAVLFIFFVIIIVIDVKTCGGFLCSSWSVLYVANYLMLVLLVIQWILDIITATIMIPRIGKTAIMVPENYMIPTDSRLEGYQDESKDMMSSIYGRKGKKKNWKNMFKN